ncbi:hypothetical protein EV424DRAFT_1629725, partial [Suillus variegatus]
IQADDVSHLLLLNRRKPASRLKEIQGLWKNLRDLAGRGPGAKKWDEREREEGHRTQVLECERWIYGGQGWVDVCVFSPFIISEIWLRKGLQFYQQLTDLSATLTVSVKSFITDRRSDRDRLVGQADIQQRLAVPQTPAEKPPLPPPPRRSAPSLDSSFASMNLQGSQNSVSPPPKPPQASYSTFPPPPQSINAYSNLPPPPQQPARPAYTNPVSPNTPSDPYASLGAFGSQFSTPRAAPPVPRQQTHSASPQRQSSFSLPPPPPSRPQYAANPQIPQTYGQQAPPPPQSWRQYPPQTQPIQQGSQYQNMPPPPPPSQGHDTQQYYQGYGR